MKFKRILSLLLALALLAGLFPAAFADDGPAAPAEEPSFETIRLEEEEGPVRSETELAVNPLYRGLIDEEALYSRLSDTLQNANGEPVDCEGTEGLTELLREGMKQRDNEIDFRVVLAPDETFDTAALLESAMAHTGEPTEGDYLRWQLGGYGWSYSYQYKGGARVFEGTLAADYYTTAEQERELDAAVETVLGGLDLDGLGDYGKTLAIYRYLCDNVVYDYEHYEDDEYVLQFTAYAALIDGTAVCQGYALLLYRMLLTEGVDSRIVTSYTHAWNIIRMDDGYYYNADSTWDAGLSRYYWFLRSMEAETFGDPDHEREEPYCSEAFFAAYPMGPTDYVPKPFITKHPAGEIVYEGGSVTFIARAEYYTEIAWRFYSPDAATMIPAAEAAEYFGCEINGLDSETLEIVRVPAKMDGWCVEAMFKGPGGVAYSNGARIQVIIKSLPAPELTEAFNSATGVRVSWLLVDGAVKYELLRKNLTKNETEWTVVGETAECSLIDKTVASASRYTFTVRAIDGDGTTGLYDEAGRTCTYIAKADVTDITVTAEGVRLQWSKPAGAKNFRVMRRPDGTAKWTVLDVVLGTEYLDTTAEKGVKYWYTVRGVSMDNTVLINSYNGTGWSMKPLETPVLTEAFNSATGVRVSWKPNDGAVKYRLLRKNLTKEEADWSTVTETTELTFIDTSAASASRYTYTVECIDSNGRICSAQGNPRTCTYIAMAKITSIGGVTNGVKLTWSKPAGAKNFRIFRKVDGENTWTALTDVQGTTYTDTTAEKGVKYWYTVRAITMDGSMYINSYNSYGWSVTRK
ncbi:MAG: hypothetical protein K6G17_01995 [Oscillospiraceae bacterium]|nr:hypothetical protein [Oscillospiraceae bacterium]